MSFPRTRESMCLIKIRYFWLLLFETTNEHEWARIKKNDSRGDAECAEKNGRDEKHLTTERGDEAERDGCTRGRAGGPSAAGMHKLVTN